MNRTLRLAFLASLLANVLLLGFVIGDLPHRFSRGDPREQRIESVLQQLPQAVQEQFRQRMQRNRASDDQRREQIREARQRTIDILLAEPFDAAAYDQEVARIDELRGQGSRDMAATVKDVAKDLPLEQRRVLAELLNRPPRGR